MFWFLCNYKIRIPYTCIRVTNLSQITRLQCQFLRQIELILLVQPRGWTLCLYWVTCLCIRAFAMAVYMRRRSIIIRAFDGNARLLAKITAVCIAIYIFLWGNLSRAIIYFSNSIKERFTNSTREFCNSLFADVRFGLTIRNKLVYV